MPGMPATEDRHMDFKRFVVACCYRAASPPFPIKGPLPLVLFSMHGAAIYAAATLVVAPPSAAHLLAAATSYSLLTFGITAGHHRYFSHRAFRTSRPFQFALGLLGSCAWQRGPICWYWASAEHDPPVERHAAAWRAFPELATLDRLHFFPGLLVASSIYSYGGAEAALWGFVVPVVGCWNGIFSIGSLCHGRSAGGTRPFETGGCDQSTNVWWVAWLTLGDGWHNNHHAFRWSARHGLRWYEVDVTYALLRGLEACGVVWDLKVPSEEQIARAEQRSASGARLASRAADSQSES